MNAARWKELARGALVGATYAMASMYVVPLMGEWNKDSEMAVGIVVAVVTAFAMGYWPKWIWPGPSNDKYFGTVLLGFAVAVIVPLPLWWWVQH